MNKKEIARCDEFVRLTYRLGWFQADTIKHTGLSASMIRKIRARVRAPTEAVLKQLRAALSDAAEVVVFDYVIWQCPDCSGKDSRQHGPNPKIRKCKCGTKYEQK